MRVVIVGGGISGLVSAYLLEAFQKEIEITLVERTEFLGGAVQSLVGPGYVLEGGPDSLVDRPGGVVELARALGLSSQLVGLRSGTQGALVYRRDGWTTFGRQETQSYTLAGGVQTLVDRLVKALRHTELTMGVAVTGLQALDGRHVEVSGTGLALTADQVVLAIPAPAAGHLIESLDPARGHLLQQISYEERAVVGAVYSAQSFHDPRVFTHTGFLVARDTGHSMTACTWLSSKWAYPGSRQDRVLLRTFWGPPGPLPSQWSDHELVDLHVRELRSILGLEDPPEEAVVFRHDQTLPAVLDGTRRLVFESVGDVSSLIGVVGPFVEGPGLSDCVRAARREVARLVQGAKT